MEKYGLSLVQTFNKHLITISFNTTCLYSRHYRRGLSTIRTNNNQNDQPPTKSSPSAPSKTSYPLAITKTSVTPLLRYQVMKNLIKEKKFHEIVAKGDELLFEEDITNKINIRWKNDVNFKEVILYFNSLIVLRKWDQVL